MGLGDVLEQAAELVNSLEPDGDERRSPGSVDLTNPWEILPIKKALVWKIREGLQGHTWNSWGTKFLIELMDRYGPKEVLFAIGELRRELRSLDLDMPDYLRREVPSSSVNLALKQFPGFLNEELLRQIDEERKERWLQFFVGYLSDDDL